MPVLLIDVELNKPLPTIDIQDPYTSAWCLVRDNGKPVGYAKLWGFKGEIKPDHLACEIVRSCGDYLIANDFLQREGIQKEKMASNEYLPFISVLICTRNRTDSLKHTLDSVMALDYPDYEVVVVDNCPSNDDTKNLVSTYPVRYVMEPVAGHSWARNRAIIESKGEVVAFLDDDMLADSNWLRAVADSYADPTVMAVNGLVLPLELETHAQELFENTYGGFDCGYKRRKYQFDANRKFLIDFSVGPYMSFRKSILEKVGMFDISLGLPVGGAEDLDLLHRIMDAGYVIEYNPEAIRLHKHRETYDGLKKQITGYSKCFSALITKYAINEPDRRLKIILYGIRWYTWFFRQYIRRMCGQNALPMRFTTAEALSALKGPYAYWKSRRDIQKKGLPNPAYISTGEQAYNGGTD